MTCRYEAADEEGMNYEVIIPFKFMRCNKKRKKGKSGAKVYDYDAKKNCMVPAKR